MEFIELLLSKFGIQRISMGFRFTVLIQFFMLISVFKPRF